MLAENCKSLGAEATVARRAFKQKRIWYQGNGKYYPVSMWRRRNGGGAAAIEMTGSCQQARLQLSGAARVGARSSARHAAPSRAAVGRRRFRAGSHLGKQVGKDVGEGVGGWGQVLPPAVAGASTSPPAGLPRPDASPWLARGAAPPFLPHAAAQPQPPAGGTTTVATAAATADGPRLPRSGAAPGPAR
jgi:hypothetical protein